MLINRDSTVIELQSRLGRGWAAFIQNSLATLSGGALLTMQGRDGRWEQKGTQRHPICRFKISVLKCLSRGSWNTTSIATPGPQFSLALRE